MRFWRKLGRCRTGRFRAALAVAAALLLAPGLSGAGVLAGDAPPGAEVREDDRNVRRHWPRWLPRLRRDRGKADDAVVRAQAPSSAPATTQPAEPPAPTATDPSAATPAAPKTKVDAAAVAEDVNVSTPEAAQRSEAATLLVRALGLQDSPTKVYGWLENSYTGNTNGLPKNGVNFGVFPNHLANSWQGNQYYLILENPIKADDTINFGFRVDTLFGNDWQFTKEYGLFDRAFVPNHFAGLDFPQIYGEVHLPVLTPWGLDVRGGRFYAPNGFESVQATKRPLLSVPYTFNFSPFTWFGALGTLHLLDNNRANLYAGTINGWDRWIDANYKWGVVGGYSLASRSGKTTLNTFVSVGPYQLPRFAPADSPSVPLGVTPPPYLAGRFNPGYASTDRTFFSTTLTHNWTDRLTEAVQTDQTLQKDTPGFGPGGSPRDTSWYSLAHWFLYGIDGALADAKLTAVWRIEAFRDNNGAATGVAADFFETSVGLIYKPRPWLWVRPEARYDWARGSAHPYSDGTRESQLILDADVIFLF